MTTELVSLEEIKSYLDLGPDDNKFNLLLQFMRGSATDAIKRWSDKDIVETTYTETYDVGLNQDIIQLNHYPVISITSITDYDTSVASTGYKLYKDKGTIKRVDNCWYSGDQTVTVVYVAGYATIPDSIKEACLEMVFRKFNDRAAGNLKFIDTGTIRFTRAEMKIGMDQDIASKLSFLKRLT